jgi:hypothetical protein
MPRTRSKLRRLSRWRGVASANQEARSPILAMSSATCSLHLATNFSIRAWCGELRAIVS